MRHPTIGTVALALMLSSPVSTQEPAQAIENVAAFARLYGVVRYFYPSDAAAALQWDRFAIHGVKLVRTAAGSTQLEASLRQLFAPLGPGIEIARTLSPSPPSGSPDRSLIAWRYLGAGMVASSTPGPYRGKRTNRSQDASNGIDGFVSMMQTVPTQDLRGKAIRLRGQVRATTRDAAGSAALWLRVDRPDQQVGFFDNMATRPIRDSEWREYTIEGTVADDAVNVAFGAMASGPVTADFDAMELAVREASGTWTPIAIKDPGFESTSADWMRVGTSTTAVVGRPAEGPREGQRVLRLSARPGASDAGELFEDAVPANGAHVDIDLGSSLRARVPLALTEAQAAASKTSDGLAALGSALAALPAPDRAPDLDYRLGDVVVAWNVFRHFYPYWPESAVDWDARLRVHLDAAHRANTRLEHENALRMLVADLGDGHGSISPVSRGQSLAVLPLQFSVIEGRLVVIATDRPDDVPAGAVVLSINGAPADKRISELSRLSSGTPQWKRARAAREIALCEKSSTVTLALETGAGTHEVSVPCEASRAPAEKRPDAITDVSDGIWYVDVTRATIAQMTPVLPKLASARGVVFDVRGYPTDAGFRILPHLLREPETDRWMHVAKITGPFGQSDGWQSFGWNLKPATPRIGGSIVFLTDGRAISYAESVLGYVADRKLGTIVGSPTAGANGNVARIVLPSLFSVSFTGMRVTGHDGHTQHHLVGVKPGIPAEPTIAGIRAGRDEVLDVGLSVVRKGTR